MAKYARAKDIKVGVIGYGGAFDMGKSHLEEMRQAGMTPTAVCELNEERLDVAKSDFPGIETYATVERMLDKSAVDLLAVITPHNTHAPLALKCLKAGRHVVCEKPLAITTAECDAMVAAARRAKVVLSTYHNRHWDGCVMAAVKAIRAGAIGEVFRIDAHMAHYGRPRDWWRTSKTVSGGVLYDWGVHLLEYGLQIIDSGMTEVSGFAKKGHWAKDTAWKNDTVEDEGFAVVRFKNGAWMTLCISNVCASPTSDWLEIRGTKGTYSFNYREWTISKCDEAGCSVVTKGKNPESEGWRLYQNIADHLVKGKPLVITPEWARRPIHILDLADRSARAGHGIKVKYS